MTILTKKQVTRDLKTKKVPFDVRVKIAKQIARDGKSLDGIVDIFVKNGFVIVDKQLKQIFDMDGSGWWIDGFVIVKRKNTVIKLVVSVDSVIDFVRIN